MKKLALIGLVVAGLLLSTSVALAKPTGLTPGEIQAQITRDQSLNLKYGDYEYAQSTKPIVSEKLSGLGIAAPDTKVSSSGQGFDWNDAGVGAALAFVGLLGIGAVLTVRNQGTQIPYWPITH